MAFVVLRKGSFVSEAALMDYVAKQVVIPVIRCHLLIQHDVYDELEYLDMVTALCCITAGFTL